MANEDVIAVFRADISDMQKKLTELKKGVKGFGDSVDGVGKKTDSLLRKTSSGFNGLGNSINQLSRELPAFTYSAQTGFLALSNNIPMLADQITQLKAKNLELVASGQKSIPVWKSVTTALLSWQTALSVGVTLLTVYGGKIFDTIKIMLSSANTTQIAKERQEAINKEFEKSIELQKQLKEQTLGYKRGVDEVLGVLIKGGNKGELSILTLKDALGELNKELGTISEQNTVFLEDGSASKDYYAKRKELFDKEKAEILANIALIENELKLRGEGSNIKEKEKAQLTEREKILEKIAKLEVKIQNSVILKGTYNEKDKEALRDQLNLLHQIDEEYAMILDSIGDIQKIEFKQNDGGLAEFRKGEESKTKVKADELKKQNDAFNEFQAKEREENIKNREEFKKVVIDSAYQLSGSYLDITNNFTQSHIDSITSAKEANIAQIDNLLEHNLISQKEYEAKRTKLEREADSATRNLLLKQFEREKAVNTARAIMDGILAVQKAYAELGPIFGLPAAIIVGAISTANVVAIQTQPTPKFEKGGHVKGKRHREGGVFAELEGGEFVNNRISTQKYKEELESANNLSLERLIHRKHIMPAIRKEREKIFSSISSSFNDGNLLMSDRETRSILRDIRDGIKDGSGYSKSVRFKNV